MAETPDGRERMVGGKLRRSGGKRKVQQGYPVPPRPCCLWIAGVVPGFQRLQCLERIGLMDNPVRIKLLKDNYK
jgi:hypothetical protein